MRTQDPAFVPSFCPWPECESHRDPARFRHVAHGTYSRKAEPRRIRRFRCLDCDRTFCTQTFDTTYFLKKPQLQPPLFDALAACSAFRQLGRSWRVAHPSLVPLPAPLDDWYWRRVPTRQIRGTRHELKWAA